MSFYVTTPIYYVNAEPHLGHAYSTIAADVLARHMRQRGEDVFFLTGTDEHGEPVVHAAERQGLTPQQLVDRNAPHFRAMGERIDASNDFFIRTTDPRHVARVQEVVQRVHDNGHVYEGVYEGWYCPRCADFKTETERGPDNTCPIHETPLERKREENWFFRLSAFEDDLRRLYAERPDFVLPRHHYNEALAFIEGGLEDVSLSRPELSWGVPLPWEPEQVMYVWFDALLNYYTALSFAREGEDLTDRYWPATWHVIGKDILKFHTVYWPAFLIAAGIEVPERVCVHGFLLMGEKKMSKSLGNVLDPIEVVDRFGADALRFYCFREVSFGHDGSVSPAGFEARYETELANDWGNLASRTLAMIERYRDGVVPDAAVDPALAGGDDGLDGLDSAVRELLDRAELTQALEAIWARVRRLNRYVEESRPWDLAKDEAGGRRPPGPSSCSTSSRGCGSSRCCSPPTCRRPAAGCSTRSASRGASWPGSGRAAAGRRSSGSSPCSRSSSRSVIDTHCHLGLCEAPDAELVADALAVGVRRILSVGIDEAAGEEAIATAESHEQVLACVGRHPNGATGFDDAAAERIAALAAHPRVAAVGETGLDYYRDRAPRADQRRAFRAQIEVARAVAKPLVIHVRDGGQTTDGEALAEAFETLSAEADGLTVVLHCFSSTPERAREAAEHGWYCSFAGNLTYPSAAGSARPRRRSPTTCSWSRPTRRSSPRSRAAGAPTTPPTWSRPPRPWPRCAASPTSTSRRWSRPTRRPRSAGSGMVRLGQNFLADPNLLDAIVRDARLEPGDVVLEVGGGEGALTAELAPLVERVHVVELDERLRPTLERVAAEHPNVELHFGDALRLDLTALDPAPTRIVSNLPYSIATPLILRTDRRARRRRAWTLMVQREIADRLRAEPGSRTYGAPSVLVQLACRVRLLRAIDRAVFRPRPRVDSALIELRPRAPRGRRRPRRSRPRRVRAPAQVARALARARPPGVARSRPRRARAPRAAGRRASRARLPAAVRAAAWS